MSNKQYIFEVICADGVKDLEDRITNAMNSGYNLAGNFSFVSRRDNMLHESHWSTHQFIAGIYKEI